MKKQCTRCINDTTVRRIQFDENGVCNYCNRYDTIKKQLNDYPHLEQLFSERIERIKGKFDYDVALGISGGKDSVFVLHELVRKYQLKVKTFTLNNGFLSDSARYNIDKIVKEFDVEHEYIDFSPEILKKFYRYSMKKWLTPCVACSYLGYATMINYTAKINAGLCIHGRSPQQMLRYYGDDVFTALVDAGLQSPTTFDVNELYTDLLKSIECKVDKRLMAEVRSFLLNDIKNNSFREFVSYFLYHKYDEKEIVEFLLKNTSWTPKKDYDHYDCKIHNAAHYIYQCAEGRPHCLPEISFWVRNGDSDKQTAKDEVKKKHYEKAPKEELKLLCDFVNLSPSVLLTKAKIYRKFLKK